MSMCSRASASVYSYQGSPPTTSQPCLMASSSSSAAPGSRRIPSWGKATTWIWQRPRKRSRARSRPWAARRPPIVPTSAKSRKNVVPFWTPASRTRPTRCATSSGSYARLKAFVISIASGSVPDTFGRIRSPSKALSAWRWRFTKPGDTRQPVASISLAAVAAERGPTASIRSPVSAMSTSSAEPRTRAFLMTTSTTTAMRSVPSSRRLRAPVHGHGAALEHQLDARGVEQHRDVGERVAVHDDQVGEPALLERADLTLERDALRGPLGARAQRLHGREPGVDQTPELARVLRVTMAAGVGAGRDCHAELERPLDAGEVVLLQLVRAGAHVGRCALAVILVDEQRRDEERALARHPLEVLRVLVEVATVLDRIDAGHERGVEPGTAKRVAHHATAERVRLRHQRLHLFEREGRVERPVARP